MQDPFNDNLQQFTYPSGFHDHEGDSSYRLEICTTYVVRIIPAASIPYWRIVSSLVRDLMSLFRGILAVRQRSTTSFGGEGNGGLSESQKDCGERESKRILMVIRCKQNGV